MSEQNTHIPYFEDNNIKGRSRGEAIFGDKQAALVEQTIPSVIEKYKTADTEADASKKSGAAALLAARYMEIDATAAANDWGQDRIDEAKAEAERTLGNK